MLIHSLSMRLIRNSECKPSSLFCMKGHVCREAAHPVAAAAEAERWWPRGAEAGGGAAAVAIRAGAPGRVGRPGVYWGQAWLHEVAAICTSLLSIPPPCFTHTAASRMLTVITAAELRHYFSNLGRLPYMKPCNPLHMDLHL
jgi:hypothetical protein